MAVLIECISVVVRRSAIHAKFPQGWDGFLRNAPNGTLCYDGDIARVGFMSPPDVEAYVRRLQALGFIFVLNGKCIEIAVVDQMRGFTMPCDWLEFGHATLPSADAKVSACRMAGSKNEAVATPEGWDYSHSLSRQFGFTPTELRDDILTFLRHENGVDVFLNNVSGEVVYIGRTS